MPERHVVKGVCRWLQNVAQVLEDRPVAVRYIRVQLILDDDGALGNDVEWNVDTALEAADYGFYSGNGVIFESVYRWHCAFQSLGALAHIELGDAGIMLGPDTPRGVIQLRSEYSTE